MLTQIKITSYRVSYSSNTLEKRIGLLNGNKEIAQLFFHSNDILKLPLDKRSVVDESDQYFELHYHHRDFANCLVILKDRRVKFLYFLSEEHVVAENGISLG